MPLTNLIARQSARPRGLLGRLIFGRYLDRANRRINDLVHDTLDYTEASRVLEIGFGGGALLLRVAQNLDRGLIHGVEISDQMLARTAARANSLGLAERVRLQHGSADALPFDDAGFDHVCSVNTLYFWPDLEAGIREIARVCRPGGVLVLGFSSRQALAGSGWTAQGFRAYPLDEIEDAYRRGGFDVDRCERAARAGGGELFALRGVRSL